MKRKLSHILPYNPMKQLFQLILAICCIVGYSCSKDKDQKLISEVAGEYKIESIVNYNDGQATTLTFIAGTIYFQDCTMKDGVGGNCTGWYEINGLPQVTFQYTTRKNDGAKILNITNPSSFKEPFILGLYKFEDKGGFTLLNGVQGTSNGVSFSDYSDIKLSKK
ncbi:MAG TPA: hypothetical protein VGB63_15920 [Pedobacter sp.]|jgi:hypothetical protein